MPCAGAVIAIGTDLNHLIKVVFWIVLVAPIEYDRFIVNLPGVAGDAIGIEPDLAVFEIRGKSMLFHMAIVPPITIDLKVIARTIEGKTTSQMRSEFVNDPPLDVYFGVCAGPFAFVTSEHGHFISYRHKFSLSFYSQTLAWGDMV